MSERAIEPRGDWMTSEGLLTGRRNGLLVRRDGQHWYADLDGYRFGPARVLRYGDADYLDVSGTAWTYSLDEGEADRLISRGLPVTDNRAA